MSEFFYFRIRVDSGNCVDDQKLLEFYADSGSGPSSRGFLMLLTGCGVVIKLSGGSSLFFTSQLCKDQHNGA